MGVRRVVPVLSSGIGTTRKMLAAGFFLLAVVLFYSGIGSSGIGALESGEAQVTPCSPAISLIGSGQVRVRSANGPDLLLTQDLGAVPLSCDEVTELTAEPSGPWRFDHWQGVSTQERYKSTISAVGKGAVTAVFVPRTRILQPVETPFYNRDGLLVNSIELLEPINAPYAVNSLASPSNEAPEISVWYGDEAHRFGEQGTPQQYVNILGNVSDPDGNLTSLSYSLNSGTPLDLAYGGDGSAADGRRLWNVGDFNIDLDKNDLVPPPGSNEIVITASDSMSARAVYTTTVSYDPANRWGIPYRVEWADAAAIQDKVQVIDGKWDLSSDGIRPLERGYDRLVAIGEGALDQAGWDEFEVTVEVTVHGIDTVDTVGAPAVGIVARWQGHTDRPILCTQPKCGYLPVGAVAWYEWDRRDESTANFMMWAHISDKKLVPNSPMMIEDIAYYWKLRVENSSQPTGTYQLKVWKVGDPEPASWLAVFDESLRDGNYEMRETGSILLLSHHVDVTFGDIKICPLEGCPEDATPTATPTPVSERPILYLSSTSGGSAGGVGFNDEDILAYDTELDSWSLFFDGSDVGLDDGNDSDIDAFHLREDNTLLFSIVGSSTLPDVGSVDDSDIILFTPTSTGEETAGSFSLYFDGSDVGLDEGGENIDALTLLDNGDLVLSVTGSWSAGGLSGLDEDLLRFAPASTGANTSGSWSLFFDGSDVGLNTNYYEDIVALWSEADASALYLSTLGPFSVNGANGDESDILRCRPDALGSSTACAFDLYWDGSNSGYAGEKIRWAEHSRGRFRRLFADGHSHSDA